MKKIVSFILGIILVSLFNVTIVEAKVLKDDKQYEINMKRDLLACMISYPEIIKGVIRDKDGKVYLVTKDEKKVLYDDKIKKQYEDKFYNADIEDTMSEEYPLESINEVMKDNKDPGRCRCYSLLNALYGCDKSEIDKNIHTIATACGNITFNKANNASENLKLALNEASHLISKDNSVASFVMPLSGGYNYRYIKDTRMLSPHAYGIAVDLNKNDADYWKWATKEQGSKRISQYPEELVKIFEKYGFVWGGKWSHFDILHFEYRPEIITKAKYFKGECINEEEWYGSIPLDENVESMIEVINKVFQCEY